jgi:hypothetical protein
MCLVQIYDIEGRSTDWGQLSELTELYRRVYSAGQVFNLACSNCGINKPVSMCSGIRGCKCHGEFGLCLRCHRVSGIALGLLFCAMSENSPSSWFTSIARPSVILVVSLIQDSAERGIVKQTLSQIVSSAGAFIPLYGVYPILIEEKGLEYAQTRLESIPFVDFISNVDQVFLMCMYRHTLAEIHIHICIYLILLVLLRFPK